MKLNKGELKYTQEEYQKYINSINPNLKVIGEYRGSKYSVEFECLICGHHFTNTTNKIVNGQGCSVCKGYRVEKGINDLWTKRPDLAHLLLNPNDGYTNTIHSRAHTEWKCPNCGNIKKSTFHSITQYGLHCDKCSDKISYPEKFIREMLKQLNVDFVSQKQFEWSNKRKYDFYFDNIICETHGEEHYTHGFSQLNVKRGLFEEQANDKYKKTLALNNGINEDRYIELDCRKSEREWIRQSILNSNLSKFYDLSVVDWELCDKNCCTSDIVTVCDLWNQGYKVKEIQGIMNLSPKSTTICRYLRKGTELGLCAYDGKIERLKGSQHRVKCITTNEIFNSISEAERQYGINNISACCRGMTKSAGKHPITKEKMIWEYY